MIKNNYKQRVLISLIWPLVAGFSTTGLSMVIASTGAYKNSLNAPTLFIFFLFLGLFFALIFIYYVVTFSLGFLSKPVIETLKIGNKELINRKLGIKSYSIIPDKWIVGFGVSKNLYDAVNIGDKVEVTYRKFSKLLISIRKF